MFQFGIIQGAVKLRYFFRMFYWLCFEKEIYFTERKVEL